MSIKVPACIKEKMHRIAKMHKKAADLMDEVEEWLEARGIDTSVNGLRDGAGIGLEELEYGNDQVDEICERIENFETWQPEDIFTGR